MAKAGLTEVTALLERHGLLLLQDSALPNVAALVAGAPIRGSWWGHPASKQIYDVVLALEHEVMTTKLVDGKVTFVHRRLWPALVAVGNERAAWQTAGLSDAASELLAAVDAAPVVRASGAAAKELETRLLVASSQVHTEEGAHALELVTWKRFAKDAGLGRLPAPAAARAELEKALAAMPSTGKPAKLPWQRSRR